MAAALSWIMDSSDYAERSPLFPNPLVCLRDMAQTAAYEVGQTPALHFKIIKTSTQQENGYFCVLQIMSEELVH